MLTKIEMIFLSGKPQFMNRNDVFMLFAEPISFAEGMVNLFFIMVDAERAIQHKHAFQRF